MVFKYTTEGFEKAREFLLKRGDRAYAHESGYETVERANNILKKELEKKNGST